ncbi:MAG TPA: rRNA maturation RNase YbeY [Gammaproteobacteria bacterium]|jgi:rRNA maturation RNase YbeY|nr:rRNA maturation RNase YbeY [Gammaproteobacteria bacterium]
MSGVTIAVQDASGGARFPPEDRLRAWALAAVAGPPGGEAAPPAAGEVLIRIVGTQESAQLNQRYRGRRGPTNVLAFLSDLPATPASQAANAVAQGGATAAVAAGAGGAAGGATPGDAASVVALASSPDASPAPAKQAAPSADALPLGDLVICAPVISREAREQRKSFDAHWAHIVVHGVLHLLGYDHETDEQAQTMEDRERKILAGLGFRDPYALRD